jgi:Protein kinase domain
MEHNHETLPRPSDPSRTLSVEPTSNTAAGEDGAGARTECAKDGDSGPSESIESVAQDMAAQDTPKTYRQSASPPGAPPSSSTSTSSDSLLDEFENLNDFAFWTNGRAEKDPLSFNEDGESLSDDSDQKKIIESFKEISRENHVERQLQNVAEIYSMGRFDFAERCLLNMEFQPAEPFSRARERSHTTVKMIEEWLLLIRKARDLFLDGLALKQQELFSDAEAKFQMLRDAMVTEDGKLWAENWLTSAAKQRKRKEDDVPQNENDSDWEDEFNLIEAGLDWKSRQARLPPYTRSGYKINPAYTVDHFINQGTGIIVQVHSEGGSDAREVYACKIVQTSGNEAQIRNETSSLTTCKHKHVVSVVEHFQVGGFDHIVLQPRTMYDLRSFLRFRQDHFRLPDDWEKRDYKRLGSDPPKELDKLNSQDWEDYGHWRSTTFRWIRCLAKTLAVLHSLDIQHRDIKPANILVDSRHNHTNILFADFGLAFTKGSSAAETSAAGCGSLYYAPPERIAGKEGDVFSLGCVIFEMLEAISEIVSHDAFPIVRRNYADSISDPRFADAARSLREGVHFLETIPREYQFYGLPEKLIGIVFDVMMVEKNRRYCASRVAERIELALQEHKFDGLCCAERSPKNRDTLCPNCNPKAPSTSFRVKYKSEG